MAPSGPLIRCTEVSLPPVGGAPRSEQTVCDDYRPLGRSRGYSLIDCHERLLIELKSAVEQHTM